MNPEALHKLYPYREGKSGIPFDAILNAAENGNQEGKVLGGSGRTLRFLVTNEQLLIVDAQRAEFQLKATIEIPPLGENQLFFDLKTRATQAEEFKNDYLAADGHHPDLFATKFIQFSLSYFQSLGMKVDQIKSQWDAGTINYQVFKDELASSGDEVQSAKQTWSGQRFNELGFTEIDTVDATSDPDHVVVFFSQKSNG